MLCVVTLGRHVERLEFLDVLFGDNPGLTPAGNLYQRLLANDPLEALQQAGALLKECSLTAYYDDVICWPSFFRISRARAPEFASTTACPRSSRR